MKKFNYTITEDIGISRAAGFIVKAVRPFSSKATIEYDGKSAEMDKLFQLMYLGAQWGDTIQVTIEGEDEEAAVAAIKRLFRERL